MAKKTLILTKRQLDEICGGDSSYLDGLGSKPDVPNNFSNEISASGSMDDEYPNPTTTDDMRDTMTNDWRGNAKLAGMGPITVHEMTKKEWNNVYLDEEREHGNERLKARQFGAQNGEAGKSYGATKTALSRLNTAQKTIQTGATPEIKQKAMNTVNRMKNNWNGIDLAANQYNTAKMVDKSMQQNKIGPKITSAPKETGNGKGHTPQNGIITR